MRRSESARLPNIQHKPATAEHSSAVDGMEASKSSGPEVTCTKPKKPWHPSQKLNDNSRNKIRINIGESFQ